MLELRKWKIQSTGDREREYLLFSQNYHNDTRKSSIFVACGEDFSVILTKIGEVYIFGNKEPGKLGRRNVNQQIFAKTVNNLSSIVLISAGMNYVGYIDKDGKVFKRGAGFFGRLGNGYNDNI